MKNTFALKLTCAAAAIGFVAPTSAFDLYSTDFETGYIAGADNLVGTDGWDSSNAVNSGVQGIKSDSGNLFGYLGEAAPSADFIEVYQSANFDPVASGNPILNISMDLAIFDSTNLEYDAFYIDIYNQDVDLLGSVVFDNVSLGILSWDSVGLLNDTNVSYTTDTFGSLDISINYATNQWSASYGSDMLFQNQTFHGGTSILDFGSLTFTWDVTDIANPGDNYVAFDNIAIAAIPEPSAIALLGGLLALTSVIRRRRK